jgi:hypothetical protein
MKNRNTPFSLMLAPDCQLEAFAPDVETAITLARDALPFFHQAYLSESTVVSSGDEGDASTLTCLLCGAVNPRREGATALVAMQEHQMEEHDLPAEAFQAAVRISMVPASAETYVWAFPQAVTARLSLPQASYLSATKRRTIQAAEPLPHDSKVVGLVFKSRGMLPVLQIIHLVEQDERAWYGYPIDAPRAGDPLVWPRGEWEFADPADTLE